MTTDKKDLHFLAAVVVAASELIVTCDHRRLPVPGMGAARRRSDPPRRLRDLYVLNPEAVRAAPDQQAADLKPPWPLDGLLRALTAAGVPRFADTIRARS